MGPLIAAGSGALLVAGVILLVAGLGRRLPDAPVSRPWTVRLVARWRAMGARRRLWVVLCVGAGVVTGIWTGWLAAVVLIPLVLLGIPYLLSEPPNPEVEILAALDRWLRFLGPSIATGKSIRDAIITTRGQVPQVLTTPVARVVARLDLGWTTRDALIAMADELESADADGVLAALAIASSRAGSAPGPCSPRWRRTPRCGCAPCARSRRNEPNPGPLCGRSWASRSRSSSRSGGFPPAISPPTGHPPGSSWRWR